MVAGPSSVASSKVVPGAPANERAIQNCHELPIRHSVSAEHEPLQHLPGSLPRTLQYSNADLPDFVEPVRQLVTVALTGTTHASWRMR